MDQDGHIKTPAIMQISLSPALEVVCISLRSTEFRMVRVKPDRPTRTGFVLMPESAASLDEDLDRDTEEEVALEQRPPSDEEERAHASLLKYLYEYRVKAGWGGVGTTHSVSLEDVAQVASYFDASALEPFQVFAGVVGITALLTGGSLELPEEVSDEELTDETFRGWMSTHDCVGWVALPVTEGAQEEETPSRLPVYYNPYLLLDLAFTASPDAVGHLWRVADRVALLVHNPERGVVSMRIPLEGFGDETEEE